TTPNDDDDDDEDDEVSEDEFEKEMEMESKKENEAKLREKNVLSESSNSSDIFSNSGMSQSHPTVGFTFMPTNFPPYFHPAGGSGFPGIPTSLGMTPF